jgi:hypothetical protein
MLHEQPMDLRLVFRTVADKDPPVSFVWDCLPVLQAILQKCLTDESGRSILHRINDRRASSSSDTQVALYC